MAIFEDIEVFLKDRYKFRYNTVLNSAEYSPVGSESYKVIDDYKLNSIWCEVQREYGKGSINLIDKLITSEFSTKVNPILEYFDSLEYSGKTDYIKELCESIKIYDTFDFTKYFKKWIVGVVANVYEGGKCANHLCLILGGEQSIGKTTFLNSLVPDDLKDYYYVGGLDPDKNDSLIRSTTNFLINLDDYFDTINGKKASSLKGYITLPSVKTRLPYGRKDIDLIKIASFCGTSNSDTFLMDASGSRRFLAVRVFKILMKHLKVNRNDLFAQAVSLYKSGFQYWLDADENKEIQQHNEQFEIRTREYELIEKYFEHPEKHEGTYMTATEILVKIQIDSSIKNLSSRKVGEALKLLGYKRQTFNKRGSKGYYVNYIYNGNAEHTEDVEPDTEDIPF